MIRISRSRSFLPPLPFPVPAFPPAVSGQRGASQEAPGDWRPVKTAPAAPSPARTPAAGQRRPASPPRRARPPPKVCGLPQRRAASPTRRARPSPPQVRVSGVPHRSHAAPALPRPCIARYRTFGSTACHPLRRSTFNARPTLLAPRQHTETWHTHGDAARCYATHTRTHPHTRASARARTHISRCTHTHTLKHTHVLTHTHALSHTHSLRKQGCSVALAICVNPCWDTVR